MLSVNVWITPATSVLEKFSDESLLSGWSWWFSVQSLKFHLELIYVLNINVFMFVFKRKLIQQKVEKKLIIFLFLFTKQRIIIIIMMWGFFFSSNRWTGVLHGQNHSKLPKANSANHFSHSCQYKEWIWSQQAAGLTCSLSGLTRCCCHHVTAESPPTDWPERGKDDFKLSCAKLAYTDTCSIIQ